MPRPTRRQPNVEKRKTMKPIRDDGDTDQDEPDTYAVPGGGHMVKPDDQLQLTTEQLKEEITRILTANNPHAPQNIVRYSFKEKQFKPTTQVDQLAIHFQLDGNMIHKDSDEARKQMARTGGSILEPAPVPGESASQTVQEGGEVALQVPAPEEAADKGEEGAEKVEDESPKKKGGKKLTNQFNYSERAAQTYNNPLRERATATEPPPRLTFSGNVTQWEIFDAYQEDFEKQEKNKEKSIKAAPTTTKKETKKKKMAISDGQNDDISKILSSAKVIERMVNQNTFDEVAQDFKYFEDQSDEYRENEGTLLPLWTFSFEKAKKLAITSICWNPMYPDFFATAHGSYDFMKQSHGMILMYSMKNPSHPECVYNTDSGVMCLDMHMEHPYLIAVGFYDGSVGVYNVKESKSAPVFLSNAKTGKHTDPVWQVRWQKDDLDNNLNFFSVSSDGRVTCWTLVKNELHYHDIIKLALNEPPKEGPDGVQLTAYGGGTCFAFHPEKDYLFLVGTEEGKIHVCSKAYSSTFLDTYEAHHMAVYTVSWNLFHTRLFITCSADWSVKIWDRGYSKKEPLFTFDLNSAVGDVSWAPYSSTVFAAVTADGKVHVFDLNVNKYDAICEQLVTPKKKTKLTHISFNKKHPIILVGDDRGYVTTLKLSPNLRKQPKEKKGQDNMKPEEREQQRREFEIQKIEKLLAMVRQPDAKTEETK